MRLFFILLFFLCFPLILPIDAKEDPQAIFPPLLQAALSNDLEGGRMLLLSGADPNEGSKGKWDEAPELLPEALRIRFRYDIGVTPLMVAASLGHQEFCQLLLEAGAELYRQTRHYKSHAIQLACVSGQPKIAQFLLGEEDAKDYFVVIDLEDQTLHVFHHDQLIINGPISSGKKGYETPTGLFVVTDKHKNRVSNIYHVSMPYFLRLSCSAVGMHAGRLPGYPASHGCIRLPKRVAKECYQSIPVGTLVEVRH